MITAPYNFVPLNKEVFYPEWSEQVSHDIPFSDGESGEIEITITAKSPIFIRNHSDNKEKPSSKFCHFINENGAKEFYIPGSSFKGMVRSVLEIMSFSKISIDEERFKKPLSVRDMTPKQYCLDSSIKSMKKCPQNQRANLFTSEIAATAQNCGFLKINQDGTGTLIDCGKTISIHHNELKKFEIDSIRNLDTAEQKYNQLNNKNLQLSIKVENQGRRQVALKDGANKTGQLVLCGDIQGKKNEFIFIKNNKIKQIQKNIIDNFKKVYFQNEKAEDGQYWFKKFKANNQVEIPVFYTGNDSVQAIGLTQIFKLAYKKTIFDATKQATDKNKLDLAETIFGTEKNKLALKGRVQFSHLKCTTERYEKEIDAILGSPNPTYYPNYIRQYGKNGKVVKYKTLMDSDAVISGWKRYPLHQTTMPSIGGNDNDDVKTHFKPLQSDSVFKGKLRFHNLKKVEIGALLSALTFHGQSEKYMHNIGMAKPLGYGKISIKLTPKNLKFSQDEYLKAYQDEIEKKIPNWRSSSQLRELFAMASVNTKSNQELAYQLLENPEPKYDREKNDFTGAKKAREFLLPHSGEEFISKKPHKDKKPNNQKQQSSKANNMSNLFGGEAKVKPQRKGLNIIKKADKKS